MLSYMVKQCTVLLPEQEHLRTDTRLLMYGLLMNKHFLV